MLAAMDPDSLDGDGLRDAAKNLADAMGGLFGCTKPENWEDRCVRGLTQGRNVCFCIVIDVLHTYVHHN